MVSSVNKNYFKINLHNNASQTKNSSKTLLVNNDSFSMNISEDEKFLFPDGISNMKFSQGALPNCQSLACIDALSKNLKGVKILNKMVKKNPDGKSIDVYFACMNGKSINVTLDEIEEQRKKDSSILRKFYSKAFGTTPNQLQPPGIYAIELAYAKYQRILQPHAFKKEGARGVYKNKAYHSSAAQFMKDITGLEVSTIVSFDKKAKKKYSTLDAMPLEKQNEIKEILKLAQQNPDKYILTGTTSKNFSSKSYHITWHDYSIRKVDLENNILTIVNPWDNQKCIENISLDDFFEDFESIVYTKI